MQSILTHALIAKELSIFAIPKSQAIKTFFLCKTPSDFINIKEAEMISS